MSTVGGDVGSSDSPLRNRDFMLYLSGVIFSEIGVRGTLAVNLYHVFILTDSSLFVGFVGLFQFLAVILLGPLGGALADRLDRKKLVQITQVASFATSAALSVVTWLEIVTPWHIYLAVLLNSAAAVFDNPARRALIPSFVPKSQLVQAFALVTPARELSFMIGPALGGILVAIKGPELMYAFDAFTYLFLILILAILKIDSVKQPSEEKKPSLSKSIGEGFAYVRRRPIIGQLLGMDLVATIFGAYRAVLPEISENILQVGPTGYGLLSAAVPAGALLGSWFIYRHITRLHGGRLVLWTVAGYGVACVALAQAPLMLLALAAAAAIGAMDAMGSTVRQAAIQVEIPDEIRGRVSSIQQIATRGGPSLGVMNVGAVASLIGPVLALTVGGLVPIVAAALASRMSTTLRTYDVPKSGSSD